MITREPRFWVMEADTEVHSEHLEGWWGVVDDEQGGIFAWFNTQQAAIEMRHHCEAVAENE